MNAGRIDRVVMGRVGRNGSCSNSSPCQAVTSGTQFTGYVAPWQAALGYGATFITKQLPKRVPGATARAAVSYQSAEAFTLGRDGRVPSDPGSTRVPLAPLAEGGSVGTGSVPDRATRCLRSTVLPRHEGPRACGSSLEHFPQVNIGQVRLTCFHWANERPRFRNVATADACRRLKTARVVSLSVPQA